MKHLLIILFLLFPVLLLAQENTETFKDEIKVITEKAADEVDVEASEEDKEETDTVLRYNEVILPTDTLNSLKRDKAYRWHLSLDSLLKDAKERELNKPKEVYEPRDTGPNWLAIFFNSLFAKILLYTLAILFVGFIIYRLFLSDGAFRRNSKKTKLVSEEEETVELTRESDFDREIRLALEQRNYRMAVRYQYLKSLHLLSLKNLVFLSADKTNFDYVNELMNHPLRNSFASLTLNYDYVWYGEFEIDENIYRKIDSNFKEFNSKI